MWLASVLWALKAESTQLVPLAWIRYPVRAWLIMSNWDFCNKRERETQRERESFALSLTEWNRSWFLLLGYLAHIWSSSLRCCLLDTTLQVNNIIFRCINVSSCLTNWFLSSLFILLDFRIQGLKIEDLTKIHKCDPWFTFWCFVNSITSWDCCIHLSFPIASKSIWWWPSCISMFIRAQ